jgi:hypothetical protein
VGANFKDTDGEVRLPSFGHDAAEIAAAGAACGLRVEAVVDHVPSPQALERSAKLARYVGTPVLLEVVLTKA